MHSILTLHCCAGAHPTDVRMTTRFKEDDLTEGLTGAIHETGHSLYEQVWDAAAGFRVPEPFYLVFGIVHGHMTRVSMYVTIGHEILSVK